MATVVDHLVISLGLDPRPLQSGLNQVKSLAMRFAGPIAGAFSIHKVFQNYVESVSWVAKVTACTPDSLTHPALPSACCQTSIPASSALLLLSHCLTLVNPPFCFFSFSAPK